MYLNKIYRKNCSLGETLDSKINLWSWQCRTRLKQLTRSTNSILSHVPRVWRINHPWKSTISFSVCWSARVFSKITNNIRRTQQRICTITKTLLSSSWECRKSFLKKLGRDTRLVQKGGISLTLDSMSHSYGMAKGISSCTLPTLGPVNKMHHSHKKWLKTP